MRSRENQAVNTVLRAIPPDFTAEGGVDTVRISHGTNVWILQPVWAGEGLPADMRRVSRMLSQAPTRATAIPVVTARRMSQGAREILDEEQLSWADASGRARIVVPGEVYITRLDPLPADAGRLFRWSAAAHAVAETLLTWRARQGGGVQDSIGRVATIADAAEVSVPHAARVLRQFDEQGYTAKTGAERGSSAARELRDPGRMLSDWAGHYAIASSAPAAEYHVPWREHEHSFAILATSLAGLDWALTGVAAADSLAPYLTSVPTVDVYVPFDALQEARHRLSSESDVLEVEHGGRIRIFTESEYLFRLSDDQHGLRVASPVRVYSDLLRQRGRSAEAAEFLRETAIGF